MFYWKDVSIEGEMAKSKIEIKPSYDFFVNLDELRTIDRYADINETKY